MVELRKRQLPFPTSDKPAKTLKTTPVSLDNEFSDNKSSNKPPPLQTGDTIPDLAQFGNSILLQTGESTTFESILSKSKKGVVVFTYPKANTPGCKPPPQPFLLFFCVLVFGNVLTLESRYYTSMLVQHSLSVHYFRLVRFGYIRPE